MAGWGRRPRHSALQSGLFERDRHRIHSGHGAETPLHRTSATGASHPTDLRAKADASKIARHASRTTGLGMRRSNRGGCETLLVAQAATTPTGYAFAKTGSLHPSLLVDPHRTPLWNGWASQRCHREGCLPGGHHGNTPRLQLSKDATLDLSLRQLLRVAGEDLSSYWMCPACFESLCGNMLVHMQRDWRWARVARSAGSNQQPHVMLHRSLRLAEGGLAQQGESHVGTSCRPQRVCAPTQTGTVLGTGRTSCGQVAGQLVCLDRKPVPRRIRLLGADI